MTGSLKLLIQADTLIYIQKRNRANTKIAKTLKNNKLNGLKSNWFKRIKTFMRLYKKVY